MRLPHLVLLLVIGGTATAVGAAADPIPGSAHESTAKVVVPAGVRAVVVDVDAGNVTVSAGTPKGSAREQWLLQQPKLTTSYRGGTLTIRGRCTENEVSAGSVYVGVPLRSCSIDLTLAVPAEATVNAVGDAVSVTGVRGEVKAQATSGVSLTRVGPGAVDATSDASTITLRSSHPSAVRLAANSGIALSDVSTGAVDVRSDSSSVSLTRVTAKQLTAQANSSISLQRVTATAASLTSDASTVAVTSTHLVGRLTIDANSSVSVQDTTARSADLRSSASTLDVRTSPLTDLVGSANSTVTVALPRVPQNVQLRSDASSIALAVPRSAYAVTSHSDAGTVTLRGIVIDDLAHRTLDLSANGDVTVN